MSYPTWPTSLPAPIVDGSGFQSQDNAIRSQMDAGIARVRRRYTAVPETFSGMLWKLDRAQLQTLLDFHDVTLATVLPFQWRDPRKPADEANVAVYRFRKRPDTAPIGNDEWQASIDLELLTTFQGTFLLDVDPLST